MMWSMGTFWFWICGALLVLAVIFLLAWNGRTPSGPTKNNDSPEEILKRRYARGEIDREEYERRLRDLRM